MVSPTVPHDERLQRLRSEARQLAATLPPFLIEANRVAHTVATGLHGRRRPGHGDSFWQFRPYQDGDSSYQIDWRRSALSQRIYVREHEWETAQSIWIWRDASASMAFQSVSAWPSKQHRASVIALAAAVLLTEGGEQVGLLDAGYQQTHAGPGVVRRLAEALMHMEDLAADSLPPVADIRRHSELIWVSDFLGDLKELERRIRRYAQMGCKGHLVQVLDPAEVTFPYKGQILFEDPEGTGQHFVSQAADIKSAYESRFHQHQDALKHLARHHQWSFVTAYTDQPAEPALLALGAAMGQQQ